MRKRKICVITGSRAEYGQLFWILKEIQEDNELELQLIVTGMHLSPEFGQTSEIIKNDGFKITRKVEVLLSSDTAVGISKSMGLAMISFSEVFETIRPDICLVLGDRFEIFSAVSAALTARIPVAHIHGGETTEGAIDEAFRHSITKMSHLHFTANEVYSKRVIQLGENPSHVYTTGTPIIDNICKLKLLNKAEFEESINFKLNKNNFLITFHPVTLESNTSGNQFNELLKALSKFENTNFIFTFPNSDTDGRIIIEMINDFVKNNSKNSISFQSLGQLRYLSALKHVDVVIGNSSSGLTEVPSFNKPTINIGNRQKGRLKANSVIDSNPIAEEIFESINYSLSNYFQESIQEVLNPYGSMGASLKIKTILKTIETDNLIFKKFFDL
ncbi:MAG: GDP/UDP-N,N'-diacetylbacillosamine 2-epimerase (hydrolyzing) [Ulvibacter sp.]|jgi:GDP/UDP-N,N'-diacetylbacillosamine 2-epimerase (hydrolysing)